MVEKTGLEAELSVTDHIIKTGTRGSKIEIDVLAILRNHDEFSYVVHVPDSDRMHFWQLLDDDHNEVLRGRPTTASTETKGEIYPSFAATISPEHPLYSTHKVTIDLKYLKQGERYTFRWGFVKLTDYGLFSAFLHEAKPLNLHITAISDLPRFRSESG